MSQSFRSSLARLAGTCVVLLLSTTFFFISPAAAKDPVALGIVGAMSAGMSLFTGLLSPSWETRGVADIHAGIRLGTTRDEAAILLRKAGLQILSVKAERIIVQPRIAGGEGLLSISTCPNGKAWKITQIDDQRYPSDDSELLALIMPYTYWLTKQSLRNPSIKETSHSIRLEVSAGSATYTVLADGSGRDRNSRSITFVTTAADPRVCGGVLAQ